MAIETDVTAPFLRSYSAATLDYVAFPMGGIGAGMLCLEGTGALSHVSLRHKPDVAHEPQVFSALCIKGQRPGENVARVLEGQVPRRKIFNAPDAGNGLTGRTYGLPRFRSASFSSRFPFGTGRLEDPKVPLKVGITGWSPFIPGDANASSLPAAALEFRFSNHGNRVVDAVYSFHARNFMATATAGHAVLATPGGFLLRQSPQAEQHDEGTFAAIVGEAAAAVSYWFRGGWFDPLTIAWKRIQDGWLPPAPLPPAIDGSPAPGGSLYVPFKLAPGEEKTVCLMLSWYVPYSDQRNGWDSPSAGAGAPPAAAAAESCADASCGCNAPAKPETYRPWYTSAFPDITSVIQHWKTHYAALREKTALFTQCFYNATIPAEIVEAVGSTLSILKSPTVLRQADGRLWAWEGCHDKTGCCHGTCTHVWNYTQALAHLFPDLERTLRQTEFLDSQNDAGHQNFRSSLPIRAPSHDFHAAADGQLGGIMKMHREWRVLGDIQWLKRFWPAIKQGLDYCIATWDPDGLGILVEPHHNTYDIEFWGPDGMCSSFYLGALQAAVNMGAALNEDVSRYRTLFERGRRYVEDKLFNGEYFEQDVRWEGMRAKNPVEAAKGSTATPCPDNANYSPEALEILEREGPKYQYGKGCLADGVLGAWIAEMCGVGEILDRKKVEKHLLSVFKYNFKQDMTEIANPQRPGYALGAEAGLLLCTWPRGGRLTLPFPYCDEVWTGFEYQVASHLMLLGHADEALQIVRAARARHDGSVRNPYNEYECGHWYARALSSYGMLQGLTGIRYDAVEKKLTVRPQIKGDFRAFLATATGFGYAGIRDGKPFVEAVHGAIGVAKFELAQFNQ